MVKILKLFFIAGCIVFAILSFALLGASGHQIMYFKNLRNVFHLAFSMILIINSLIVFRSLLYPEIIDKKWFFFLILTGAILKISFLAYVVLNGLSFNIGLAFMLLWLSALIGLACYYLVRNWKHCFLR